MDVGDTVAPFRVAAPLSWWASAEGLKVYRHGLEIATIPPERLPQLLSDVALVLAKRESGK